MFDLLRKQKDLSDKAKSDQIKEDKHLVKIRSIIPQKGHSIFKVIEGQIQDVVPEDFIERIASIQYINKDGSFKVNLSIKMKDAYYITALNKKNAAKRVN